MKLAMTLMVRDEADIVQAMIDHHLAQGVDIFIVTDNGSVDGTAEILAGYAARGLIDLRHDPSHMKQQSPVVTRMAQDAYTLYGADWVINADADEFFVPLDRSLTLHDIFEMIPKSIQAFLVPVTNLTGAPAKDGSGIQRLVYRDIREKDALDRAGIIAHPTPDAIHIGTSDVQVVQGNHLVSLASLGAPSPELSLEVLHLPWRSWRQYKDKVENAGRAYDSNPDLTPSPNHHGMRDYARLKAGALLPYYFMRHPTADELAKGLASGQFVEERILAETLVSPVADVEFDKATRKAQVAFAQALSYERERRDKRISDALNAEIANLRTEIAALETTMTDERSHAGTLTAELEAYSRRLVVRLANRAGRILRRN
jgi:glycosyltransferase involved in cell wall biosynthesis